MANESGVAPTVPVISKYKANVLSGLGATYTLKADQSGATILFDTVSGQVITLPPPAVGLTYDFLVTATVTSNSYKVITSAGTVFLAGFIASGLDNTANKQWVGNGTTHVAVTQAAASTNATGGILGSFLRFTCTTALQWVVTGTVVAGGVPTTPFATS